MLFRSSPILLERFDLLVLLASSDLTSSSGGNETDLLSRRSVSAQGGGMTDVLMVTTTMRMLDGVHGDTSNLGPHLSLSFEEVVAVSCLENGFLDSPTCCDDTNHGSRVT